MGKTKTTLIAIGGGDFAGADDILEEFLGFLKNNSEARLVVMTVATNQPGGAGKKYDALFRKQGVPHVSIIDVSGREEAFQESAIKKIHDADALFFTGGDQLNVTGLVGGTPLHNAIYERYKQGDFVIAGTSAGAMMMSSSMITSGSNDIAPQVGGVEIAPGMSLVSQTCIDTHFTQRGRHGRLLAAVAHYPQHLGVGIDEQTAIVVNGEQFKVVGKGTVTIMDASRMRHSNLPYRGKGENLGLFDVCVHVMPAGYKFHLTNREPESPQFREMAGGK